MSRIVANPLFADRAAAGQALAVELGAERGSNVVVVGLARGGVEVAAEIARALGAPLDVVAVRKIGHPFEREYGIGAVTPGDGVYVRASDGLTPSGWRSPLRRRRRRLHVSTGTCTLSMRHSTFAAEPFC